MRLPSFNKLVKSEPMMLFHRGRFLPTAMRRACVVEEEVVAALRKQGMARLEEAEAVVLETDGSLTVLHSSDGPAEPLPHVKRPDGEEETSPLHS